MSGTYRVGAGTGFAGDRFEPARILAERGDLDALVFECLAERTIALAQQGLAAQGEVGYDKKFLERLDDVLPFVANTQVLTNAGAADPEGLAHGVTELLDARSVSRVVAAVVGDDVMSVLPPDTVITGTDQTISDYRDRVVSANAYIGASAAVEAIEQGADIVVTGRMGDAALFAAPILHHFGWRVDELARMADATLIGHLLECAGQLTGGYFAEAAGDVPDLATIGFPFADVSDDGSAVYGKPENTGGVINRETVLEQLLYEIDDPHSYKTPDVTLDFGRVAIESVGEDRVRVSGAVAAARPDKLKVSVGIRDGYLAVGSIGYAGHRALARARLALEILRERWETVHHRDPGALRLDLLGFNSLRPWYEPEGAPTEVRARVALRTFDKADATLLNREVEALYTNGPAGGGGVQTSAKRTTGIVSALIDRELVHPEVRFVS
ncbi:MAG: DUF1446 domain-containing protein [Microbacterium sp.]